MSKVIDISILICWKIYNHSLMMF